MNLSIVSGLNKIQSWFSQAQATVTEEKLQDIPSPLLTRLNQLADQLPYPECYSKTIEEAVLSQLKEWKQNQAKNHLVILASPVQNLHGLIQESLPPHKLDNAIIINPFSDFDLRENPSQIQQNLKQAIENTINTNREQVLLILIPQLEQCFLRFIGGWDGVIWLREMISNTPQCFWLIGCNDWSWVFLSYVCKINDYLEEPVTLPKLSGEDLEKLMTPIFVHLIPKEKENLSPLFWNTLISLSGGRSEIAMQLWIQSLRISIEETKEEDQGNQVHDNDLKLVTPSLPSLPQISIEDRYLLHSLILHGKIAQHHLAITLGEKEEVIQAQVQCLLREAVILKEDKYLKINCLFYPRIKKLLYQNNYLIAED